MQQVVGAQLPCRTEYYYSADGKNWLIDRYLRDIFKGLGSANNAPIR
jgi:hypothetical protein